MSFASLQTPFSGVLSPLARSLQLEMPTPNAFVFVHFGSNPKYLELEIYALLNLRDCTDQDVVYMYSINDTPPAFVDAVRPLCTSVVSYDDAGLTYARPDAAHTSIYAHFNTLRTCNFMFAHALKQYRRVCVVESDMMFRPGVDEMFALHAPAVLTYFDGARFDQNFRVTMTEENINRNINGGAMLFAPSATKLREMRHTLEAVIEQNCALPNEMLFKLSYKTIYNLPYRYNATMYQLNEYEKRLGVNMATYPVITHMNATPYKHVERVRDNYMKPLKSHIPALYRTINVWKKEYYAPLHRKIEADVAAAAAKSNVA